jgi:hypothetical protein
MMRAISYAILLVVGGWLVTTAIALGCAFFGTHAPQFKSKLSPADVDKVMDREDCLPGSIHYGAADASRAYGCFHCRIDGSFLLPAISPDGDRGFRFESFDIEAVSAGFPFHAYSGSRLSVAGRSTDRGLYLHKPMSDPIAERILPTQPLWSGLLGNTLLYAGVLLIVTPVRRILQREIWRRRNRCMSCGYPCGPSPHCSECGAVVADHSA